MRESYDKQQVTEFLLNSKQHIKEAERTNDPIEQLGRIHMAQIELKIAKKAAEYVAACESIDRSKIKQLKNQESLPLANQA